MSLSHSPGRSSQEFLCLSAKVEGFLGLSLCELYQQDHLCACLCRWSLVTASVWPVLTTLAQET